MQMIRLILTIMLSTLAFVSMGANDCGTPYHSDIGDSLCNLIRNDVMLHGGLVECKINHSAIKQMYKPSRN